MLNPPERSRVLSLTQGQQRASFMPSAAVSALGHTLEHAHGFGHWRVNTGWEHDYA